MTSDAQLIANRRNALRSTGPKSPEGKAAVARNALRHGLTAQQMVCSGERPVDFERFHAAMRASLDPADEVEEQFVERIALCAWRLRRIARAEAELIVAFADDVRTRRHVTFMSTLFDCAPTQLATLSRYEAALDRALHRAQMMLERRQARRRGEKVPAPIAIDIAGLNESGENENYETKPISPMPEAGASLTGGPAGS